MLKIDDEIFKQNLQLTQAYCEIQLLNSEKGIAEILRSFNPIFEGKRLFSFEQTEYSDINYQSAKLTIDIYRDDMDLIYEDLFEQQIIHKKTIIKENSEKDFVGKILIAEIETLHECCSEANSHGFIDGFDCPPIDTWFYLTNVDKGSGIIMAWIPKQFIELVDIAIAVNSLDSLNWLEDYRKLHEL